MKKLLSVKDICERYGCTEKTARSYMRQMIHMEKPLRVTEETLEAWEANRTYMPQEPGTVIKQQIQRAAPVRKEPGKFIISRVRPEIKQAY